MKSIEALEQEIMNKSTDRKRDSVEGLGFVAQVAGSSSVGDLIPMTAAGGTRGNRLVLGHSTFQQPWSSGTKARDSHRCVASLLCI